MRVLEVNPFADPVGGAELYLHQLVDELRARGHAVGLFAGSPRRSESSAEACIVERPDFDAAKLVRDDALQSALREFAARFRPELVHVHNLYNFPVEMIAELGRLDSEAREDDGRLE